MQEFYEPSTSRGKLAIRQVKFTIIIAISLGIIAAAFQIVLDYQTTKKKFDTSVQQMLTIIEGPALVSAYSLDDLYAQETLSGLNAYPFVYKASISDDENLSLAEYTGLKTTGSTRWVSDAIFGEQIELVIPLKKIISQPSKPNIRKEVFVGNLKVTVDTYIEGNEFANRAGITLLSGLLKNAALALILLFVFHRFITKPLLHMQRNLKAIDPKDTASKRLDTIESHLHDELGELNSSINILLSSVEKHATERIESVKESERLQADVEMRKMREEFILKHQQRLQDANDKLENALTQLKDTQQQLVNREKFASLGELVAGVAHELNTPVGIGITASSHLSETNKRLKQRFESGEMTKSSLDEFLDNVESTTTLIERTLNDAAKLIDCFKQVSKDQASEVRREFCLSDYLSEVIRSLDPRFKGKSQLVHLSCDNSITLDSYPGIFSQIFGHLIDNAVEHGFPDSDTGDIFIDIQHEENKLILVCEDNGCGMNEKCIQKIFEPFYTTKRGEGGVGLGGTILYNLVTQSLEGEIICTPSNKGGLHFEITFDLDSSSVRLSKSNQSCANDS